MTLGEKIKEARKKCNMSQEQLAEKVNVSRSAVAKWETDKGAPDIENLKALSHFLNISIDTLLDDGEVIEEVITKEAYNLNDYGTGSKKKKKNRVMLEKFSQWKLIPLLGKKVLTKGEKIIDNMIGFLTDAPFLIPDVLNSVKNTDKEFYLAEKEGEQLLVTVTDEYIETRRLLHPTYEKKFILGEWQFTRCSYQVKG